MSLKESIISEVEKKYPGIGNDDPLASNDIEIPKRTKLMSHLNKTFGKRGQKKEGWKALSTKPGEVKNNISGILAFEKEAIDNDEKKASAGAVNFEANISGVSSTAADGKPAAPESVQPEDFLTTLAKRFKEQGWDPSKLIATWKLRYESLMISYITGVGGLCASWIGPDGHGIVTLTKTVPPADGGDGWFTWAEGEMVGDKTGEKIEDKHEIITYVLAYNSDEDAIRIQPKDTSDWSPETCCSIVIAKKNAEDDKIAEMTNNQAKKNSETITLTKRQRGG